MKTLRTPDECFDDLPGFNFSPHYAEVADGEGGTLRVHYLREGDPGAPVVLLMHGEPSWSYLYRKMIPVLTGAGLGVVAPDLVGFGRSDKPTERTDYSFARHLEWMRELLFDRLELTDINLVCQDWGGLIGLRLVGEHPDRFARVVAANTFLPTGDACPARPSSPGRSSPRRSRSFPPGSSSIRDVSPICRQMSRRPTTRRSPMSRTRPEPVPSPCWCLPVTTIRTMTPSSPPGSASPPSTGPFLTAFSDGDPITRGSDAALVERIAGAKGQPHTTIAGGGHFLQEDKGEDLARVVVDFIGS